MLLRAEIVAGLEVDFEQVWSGIGAAVTEHPDNLGQWLMRSRDEPGVYFIISDWTNEERFRAFERSAAHIEHRRKLHPFRTGGSMTVMDVAAALPKPVTEESS
ncbi:antibiotic biosynthesis monooxygenase [Streptomyces sp. LX-29]|uniref:antibiotic biosynthesis monooxygenase family protein n=1 Tax=Streptomyces sp. LX-29 TaxID=2900152 RepID=UPI00240E7F15|nr:antibiotic biosynthesis monooxygenase [Streptomyces sp. LX-29]